MLVLTLRPGEVIRIGRNVSIRIRALPGDKPGAHAVFDVPRGVSVIRDSAKHKLPRTGRTLPDEEIHGD